MVDDALCSATKTQKKTAKNVDKNLFLSKVIDALSAYEKRHPNAKTPVSERIKSVEETDTPSLRLLNRLKENWRVREEFAPLFRGYFVILMLVHSRRWRDRR